jgi:hypothetical protein
VLLPTLAFTVLLNPMKEAKGSKKFRKYFIDKKVE